MFRTLDGGMEGNPCGLACLRAAQKAEKKGDASSLYRQELFSFLRRFLLQEAQPLEKKRKGIDTLRETFPSCDTRKRAFRRAAGVFRALL